MGPSEHEGQTVDWKMCLYRGQTVTENGGLDEASMFAVGPEFCVERRRIAADFGVFR